MATLPTEFPATRQGARVTSCTGCSNENAELKRCTRCLLAAYCNRECQRKDFRRHKTTCGEIVKFNAARDKIDPVYLRNPFFMGVSYCIGSLPETSHFNFLGQRLIVVVEIIGRVLYENSSTVKVRDVTNQFTHIIFKFKDTDEMAGLEYKLRLGTYVAILQAPLRISSYVNKTTDILIESLSQIYFIP
ncbi:unnamed protein product [Lymnaea stagnalis]|uniref:MYND-type domain-containing protein n=1 Tax=Lymnaea stagnalis TaxID=6523 RepID=A0AAV2HFR1_LYMST